jgi:prepilin-type N-terminal cleavage/methylation domain-containing protein
MCEKKVFTKPLQAMPGFTMVELIFVMVLILVVAGFSTPLLKKTLSGLMVKNTALNISKIINYGQERAIVEQRYYRLRFNSSGRTYRLSAFEEHADRLINRDIPGKFGRVFSLSQGLSVIRSADEIIMYPNGMCDEFSFIVKDSRGTGYLVKVKGFGTSFDMREVTDEKY